MAPQLGQVELARRLSAQAKALQEQFEEKFWDEELNTYVIALDSGKKPCRVLSSNAGHCLFTGISSPERAARLVNTLMAEQLYCGRGTGPGQQGIALQPDVISQRLGMAAR